jgi:hypothetical protein
MTGGEKPPLPDSPNFSTMTYMIKHNQLGAVSSLGLYLVITVVLLIGAIAFGVWAFSGRADYKNNVAAKVAAAVAIAKQQENTADNAQFAAEEKSPLRTYNGPQAYGSLVVSYPKTWSAYVDDTGTGSALVDGYFYPGTVPSLTGTSSVFALRVQVLAQAYNAVVSGLQQASSSATTPTTITAYALPKVPQTVGVEVSGSLPNQMTGTMVILPLRDKTLEISTYGSQFLSDFNTNILPNFSFSP